MATAERLPAASKARTPNVVTMGGGVNVKTRDLLRSDSELARLIGYVETRKVVMPVESFVQPGTLEAAIDVELELLQLRAGPMRTSLSAAEGRIEQIKGRL